MVTVGAAVGRKVVVAEGIAAAKRWSPTGSCVCFPARAFSPWLPTKPKSQAL